MALVFTVSDAIVAASPGASVDADYFTEVKTNLQTLSVGSGFALPVYADNAAASAGGAVVGFLYAQVNGSVWAVLEA